MSKRTGGLPRLKAKKLAWQAKRRKRHSWADPMRLAAPVRKPWPKATHARERERRLRQRGFVVISMTMVPQRKQDAVLLHP